MNAPMRYISRRSLGLRYLLNAISVKVVLGPQLLREGKKIEDHFMCILIHGNSRICKSSCERRFYYLLH